MSYLLGIDVGTGSARAGLFTTKGALVAHHSREIRLWRPEPGFVEQSTENIWAAITECVREVVRASGARPDEILGLGFDATCSLVAVDENGQPVSVARDGKAERNVIVWMDHRALAETEEVNSLPGHPVYDYVGGRISPEMQTPKLLWLKRNLPDTWKRTAHFFDLPDYLTYRATGATTRSICSMTCKWTYLAHEKAEGRSGWSDTFFKGVGLGDLVTEGYARIGTNVQPMGSPIEGGLSEQAAAVLGLLPGTPVGVSIIDAHAGGLGTIGMQLPGAGDTDFDTRLALIGGTSSCHMVVSRSGRRIPGVWGPYWSSMVPGFWLNEGGQSATGALVDHVISNHGAAAEAREAAKGQGISIYEFLNARLSALAETADVASLTTELHVCPYFHGNRSPRANPSLVGMISGLHLSASIDDLALLYLATIQAIAYGTRHIIEAMNSAGYRIDTLLCCGGGTKNPVFLQQHADATGCRIVLPQEPEAVLLGAAMLGAVASGKAATIEEAMASMSGPGRIIEPNRQTRAYHDAKYRVFHRLYDDQIAYRELMNESHSRH
ncbi:ribulokinase [Spartobacteria bacterium LR76]|nr:ribulokinase [Spartobacteria bacterium LR76]